MRIETHSIGPKTMGAKTYIHNWHTIKWNLAKTMGAEPQPTQNQLDLAKIVGEKTQPFKNQNQNKINWTLLK